MLAGQLASYKDINDSLTTLNKDIERPKQIVPEMIN